MSSSYKAPPCKVVLVCVHGLNTVIHGPVAHWRKYRCMWGAHSHAVAGQCLLGQACSGRVGALAQCIADDAGGGDRQHWERQEQFVFFISHSPYFAPGDLSFFFAIKSAAFLFALNFVIFFGWSSILQFIYFLSFYL